MKKSTIILVTGLPASGKTTIGIQIGRELSIPFISKDDIKEIMFETLGWSDREWSKKTGAAAYQIIDYLLESTLAAGSSVIVESNFRQEFDNAKFQKLQKRYNFTAIQILCSADSKLLLKRFQERAKTDERHVGHNDLESIDEWKTNFEIQESQPLDIESKVITVDTTDFNKVDIDGIVAQVSLAIEKQV